MIVLQGLHVVREAFQARLFPAFHETTLGAIRHFQPEEYISYAILAAIGALLASVSLYAIGVWLQRLPAKISTPEQQSRIALLRVFADQWLVWLLILAPSPIGGMLIVAAGFFQVTVLRATFAILAAEVLWRASPLL